MMRTAALLAVLLTAAMFADGTETQTDWSGGPGTPGPVTLFGMNYDSADGIDDSTTGEITLSLEHVVDEVADAPRWSDVGDIDGDGDMDILCGAYTSDSLFWFEQMEGFIPTWERHSIGYGDGPSRCVLHDIDGDMDLDAFCGYYNDDFASWYENDGIGGGWTEHVIDPDLDGCRGLVIRDVDDDSDDDVISCSYNDDYVCWIENTDGLGTTWNKIIIGTANGPRTDDAMDIDYDGDIDVCTGAYTADSLMWWENAGYGNPWVRHTISGSFNGARAGWLNDFNGDMYIDVVAPCATGDSLCWFENADFTGTVWTRHTIEVHDNAWMANSADVDDDGDSDVMACGTGEDAAFWYENDGAGNFTKHTIVDAYTGPYFVGVFDIDGDGVNEGLVPESNADFVAYYDILNGNGILTSSILDAQEDADWGTISWTSGVPSGTSVEFFVRSSDDPGSMGDWSTAITTSGTFLSGYTTSGDDYIQYGVELTTDDIQQLPDLEDVTIDWDFVSIGQSGEAVESYGLAILSGNPSTSAVLGVSLPADGALDLSVFDLSGRIVDRITSENMEAGSYQIGIEGLTPGTYFVRMNAGDFTATEKLVLVR